MAKVCGRDIVGKDPTWLVRFFTRLSVQRRRKLAVAHAAQGGRCFYCDEVIRLRSGVDLSRRRRPDHATVEHLIPQDEGGTDHPSNLAAACTPCNSLRGSNMPSDEFRALRRDPGRWAAFLADRAARKLHHDTVERDRRCTATALRLALALHISPTLRAAFDAALGGTQIEPMVRAA